MEFRSSITSQVRWLMPVWNNFIFNRVWLTTPYFLVVKGGTTQGSPVESHISVGPGDNQRGHCGDSNARETKLQFVVWGLVIAGFHANNLKDFPQDWSVGDASVMVLNHPVFVLPGSTCWRLSWLGFNDTVNIYCRYHNDPSMSSTKMSKVWMMARSADFFK